ncbi:MAG: single-stranded-DNA-specific exonuclease RecJ, partial [Halanaerobium sp. MSAO_Bac5]
MQIKKPKKVEPKAEIIDYLQDEKIAAIAAARNLNNKDELKAFLQLDDYEELKVEAFPQMMAAVDFILSYVKAEKNILIYGDYDVDGISSTSILVGALESLSENIEYHIPDRFKEGYGLNKEVLKSYSAEIDLVISCDCGISNYEEVKFAKEMGMAFVLTDHHDLPEKLPPADYILSPRLLAEDDQGYWLPGAGMAFFLVKAIYQRIDRAGEEKDFLDLLSLAIIADVVPLIGENRYLFKTALPKLQQSQRIGLIALFNELEINANEINEKVLGFRIAPILNSAGRIDNAEKALKLLLAENKTQAASLAAQLKDINQQRKKLSQEIYLEAEKAIDKDQRKALIIYNKDWHQGVIGIAAGRIAENYQIPVVLMSYNKDKDLITASARSIEGVNINNLISQCSSLLEKHGGHAAAAGFSLQKDRLEKFKLRLKRLINQELENLESKLLLETDLEVELAELDQDFYQKLRQFAPFGEANPEPIFYTEAKILNSRDISEGRHKKLVVSDGSHKITALWWWGEEVKLQQQQEIAFK